MRITQRSFIYLNMLAILIGGVGSGVNILSATPQIGIGMTYMYSNELNTFSASDEILESLDYVSIAGTTTRISIASDGTQGDHRSELASITADGRFIAFMSLATNLVSDDTNGHYDVFVHDRQSRQTERVSIASDGMEANYRSDLGDISADGRYVTFSSGASNLVIGDANGSDDIFVHDRQTKQTTRVSIASDGTEGNQDSIRPVISANGRYIAFASSANNLVSGDVNDDDVYVHDRQTGITERVSVASDGTQGNESSGLAAISDDGRYVSFTSDATNLVTGDNNGFRDIFVHDRLLGMTERISVASDGTEGNSASSWSSVSADGRYVAFDSTSSNLVSGGTNGRNNIYVHDRTTGETTRISVPYDGIEGIHDSQLPYISSDGRYVAFSSTNNKLVSGDTSGADVFIFDRNLDVMNRVSVDGSGSQVDGDSGGGAISEHGRFVAFYSYSNELVSGDTNGWKDVFVHDRGWESNTTILLDTPDPSLVDQPMSVAFSVVDLLGGEVPTGTVTVTLYESTATCFGILSDGLGSCMIIIPAPGIYTLEAVYSGDSNFRISADTETHVALTQLFIPLVIK